MQSGEHGLPMLPGKQRPASGISGFQRLQKLDSAIPLAQPSHATQPGPRKASIFSAEIRVLQLVLLSMP